MAKVFTIPVPPKIGRKRRERTTDPRYVDGQRLLVEAMNTLPRPIPSPTAVPSNCFPNTFVPASA